MKFRFCGDADCPDWVLAEINTLSRLSSIKLKILSQIVMEGLSNPPLDVDKTDKLFADAKLDSDIDLKASIACIVFIITSCVRFNCDLNALSSELQQLGLPREHSMALKRAATEFTSSVCKKLYDSSLTINNFQEAKVSVDETLKLIKLAIKINDNYVTLQLTPFTYNLLLNNLKDIRLQMVELADSLYDLS